MLKKWCIATIMIAGILTGIGLNTSEKMVIPVRAACEEDACAGLYDNYVVGEAGTSQTALNTANDYWNTYVPENIKSLLNTYEWTIIVSGTDLTSRMGYRTQIAGYTKGYAYNHMIIQGTGVIYIDNSENDVKRALLHEVGHAVDYSNGGPSFTTEFAEIFAAEKDSFVDHTSIGDGHGISNAQEYFATVFDNILLGYEDVETNIPKTYEYMMKYIEE